MFFSLKVTRRHRSSLSGTHSGYARLQCLMLHCLQSPPPSVSHIQAGPELRRAGTYPHLMSSGEHLQEPILLEVTKTCRVCKCMVMQQTQKGEWLPKTTLGQRAQERLLPSGTMLQYVAMHMSACEGGGRSYLEEGTQLLGITPHPH